MAVDIVFQPLGPPGPPGPPGGVYIHTQSIPAYVWTVDHNLDREVSAEVVVGGERVITQVSDITSNQLTVTFPTLTVGSVVVT